MSDPNIIGYFETRQGNTAIVYRGGKESCCHICGYPYAAYGPCDHPGTIWEEEG